MATREVHFFMFNTKSDHKPINHTDQTLQHQIVVVVFILLGIIARILPHPANFTPIAAIALFSGTKLKYKWALIIPFLTMLISDYFIGFHNTMLYVYGSFGLIVILGLLLKKHYSASSIALSSLTGSILFYIITNFGVWLQSGMYPHTTYGLIHCYYMAIPFFRNTLLGDIIYATAIFGAYELTTIFAFKSKLLPIKITK